MKRAADWEASYYTTSSTTDPNAALYTDYSALMNGVQDTRRICRYFQTGSCRYGLNCMYRHEFFQQTSMVPCKFFNTPKGCKNGEGCFFLHQRPDKKAKMDYGYGDTNYIDPTTAYATYASYLDPSQAALLASTSYDPSLLTSGTQSSVSSEKEKKETKKGEQYSPETGSSSPPPPRKDDKESEKKEKH